MAKKKVLQKKTRKKVKKKTRRKASVATIGDISRKMSQSGLSALTPAELRVVENIERMKERRKSTEHTFAELEALAAEGRITIAQIKELTEMRQALEKKKRKLKFALFLAFENN